MYGEREKSDIGGDVEFSEQQMFLNFSKQNQTNKARV